MGKEYLYEFAENALKEALVDVTNKISEGYKVYGMEPMFRVANQNLRILKSVEGFTSKAVTNVVTDLLIHILEENSIEIDENKSNVVDFCISRNSQCMGYIVTDRENWFVNAEKAKTDGIDKVVYIVLQNKTNGTVRFCEPRSKKFMESGCYRYVNNILLEDFLEELGVDEFESFKKIAQIYSDAAEEIVGINTAIVPTDEALDGSRETIKAEFVKEEYLAALNNTFTDTELNAIKKVAGTNIDVLVGYEDFAKSFLSSEWYYNLQKQTDRGLDQTAIVAGYLKSVEQFIYALIVAHANRGWKIFVEHKRYTDANGNKRKYPFDANYKNTYNLTLGALNAYMKEPRNKFFSNYDSIQTKIMDFLEKYCMHTRNGYLHKDNIYTWAEINEIRNQTYCAYYLLLGYLYINNDMRTSLKKRAVASKAKDTDGLEYKKFSEWITSLMKYDDDIGCKIIYFKLQEDKYTKFHKLEIAGMDAYSEGRNLFDENDDRTVPKIIRRFIYTPFIWKSFTEGDALRDEVAHAIEKYLIEGEFAKSLKNYQAIVVGDFNNADMIYTRC